MTRDGQNGFENDVFLFPARRETCKQYPKNSHTCAWSFTGAAAAAYSLFNLYYCGGTEQEIYGLFNQKSETPRARPAV